MRQKHNTKVNWQQQLADRQLSKKAMKARVKKEAKPELEPTGRKYRKGRWVPQYGDLRRKLRSEKKELQESEKNPYAFTIDMGGQPGEVVYERFMRIARRDGTPVPIQGFTRVTDVAEPYTATFTVAGLTAGDRVAVWRGQTGNTGTTMETVTFGQ